MTFPIPPRFERKMQPLWFKDVVLFWQPQRLLCVKLGLWKIIGLWCVFYFRPSACHWAWAVGTALAQTVENKALSQTPHSTQRDKQQKTKSFRSRRQKTSWSHNGKTTLADVCQEKLGVKTHKLAQVTGMMLEHSEDDCLSSPKSWQPRT